MGSWYYLVSWYFSWYSIVRHFYGTVTTLVYTRFDFQNQFTNKISSRKDIFTLRFPFVVKALPQIVQPNGFSPVCVRSWICRALADEKFFPQALQRCCLVERRDALEVAGGVAAPWGSWELYRPWVPMGVSGGICISSLTRLGGALMNGNWLEPKKEEQNI